MNLYASQTKERPARGELESRSVTAELGSLHLVGGKAAGLVSPTLLVSKDADLLEETADHVVGKKSLSLDMGFDVPHNSTADANYCLLIR
jgi:hypothetical protein